MTGKLIAIAIVLFTAVFGGALWYFQVYAHYRQVTDVAAVYVQGVEVPVTDYDGIDADTSPIKMRGCFRVDPTAFDALPKADDAAPLIAPSWFGCFDAAALTADLASGAAAAYLAADDTPAGAAGYSIHRMIAVYPDGRAYMWRQFRED